VSVRWFHRDRGYHVVGFEFRAPPSDRLMAELARLPEIREATFNTWPGPKKVVTF
jgi:hypothetical protein